MKYFVIFLLLIGFVSILLIPQTFGIPFFTEEQKIAAGQFVAIAEIMSYHDDGIYRFYDAKIIKWLKNPLEQDIVSFRSINEKGFEIHTHKAIFEVGDYAVLNLRDYDRGFLESTFFSKKISEDEIGSEIKRIEALVKLNANPLKQFKSGILIDEIQCRNDYVLVVKSSIQTPACVKLETKQKLIERGWAKSESVFPPIEPEVEEIQKTDYDSTVIEISFGKAMTRKFLPIVFSEITTNAESLDKIRVWKFELIGHSGDDRRITWDTVPKDAGIFYEITDENGQDIIDHARLPENWAIPSDQFVYNMDCGAFQEVTGESARPSSFPIKNNTDTIIAKNSWMGIYPNSDGEYSFEFASIFETLVKMPEGAKIISQESKNCKLTQNIEYDSEGEYTDGYYTKMVFRLE